jgi:hypothetical protein
MAQQYTHPVYLSIGVRGWYVSNEKRHNPKRLWRTFKNLKEPAPAEVASDQCQAGSLNQRRNEYQFGMVRAAVCQAHVHERVLHGLALRLGIVV